MGRIAVPWSAWLVQAGQACHLPAMGGIGERVKACCAVGQHHESMTKPCQPCNAEPHAGVWCRQAQQGRRTPYELLCSQVLVSRNTPPIGSAVVSVTRFTGATGAYNIIPSSVSIGGTMRALTLEIAQTLKSRLTEVSGPSSHSSGQDASCPCQHRMAAGWCRALLRGQVRLTQDLARTSRSRQMGVLHLAQQHAGHTVHASLGRGQMRRHALLCQRRQHHEGPNPGDCQDPQLTPDGGMQPEMPQQTAVFEVHTTEGPHARADSSSVTGIGTVRGPGPWSTCLCR